MFTVNATHDPERRSWFASANAADADFPLQNLPWGTYLEAGVVRVGAAIGDSILDLRAALELEFFRGDELLSARLAATPPLEHGLLLLEPEAHSRLRARLFEILSQGGRDARRAEKMASALLRKASAVSLQLPLNPRSFTDFCTSRHHVQRMGRGRPLSLTWLQIPVGYNGRASTVRASGSAVVRPWGVCLAQGGPAHCPEPELDFELELGAWLARSTELNARPDVDAVADSIFGYCIVNDWSARAIQRFEMLLGPFLGKSFLTSVSPWMVTAEALAPFQIAAPGRGATDPPVPAHLTGAADKRQGGLAIELEALLETPAMRGAGVEPALITRTQAGHLSWTFAQMLAHQTSNGGNLCRGDLVASGTISGPEPLERACLAELEPGEAHRLPGGEERRWLLDGDRVILQGRAARTGFVPIGFGTCEGIITPSRG